MASPAASAAVAAADSKPLPLDLSHHFSQTTKQRLPSKMKQYYKYMMLGADNLAGGMPHVSYFPFDTLEAQVAKPERWTPTPNDPEGDEVLIEKASALQLSSDPQAAARLLVPKISGETDMLKKIDLATALQYGQAQGYPPLLSWIRQFTRENLHPNVPYRDGPDVTLTVGSTDGFGKLLEVIVDPWSLEKGDIRERPAMLCEKFLYNNVLTQTLPKGMKIVVVESDEVGFCVEGQGGLEDILSNWDESTGKRPHLMYTVTMGHNPTGYVMPLERRKAIYEVCSKYDVIIAEDDPYWYMQFPSAATKEAESRGKPSPPRKAAQHQPERSSGYDFLDSLEPSYLSIDVDGRVVRLDTFSKTVAPGCRLGWVTAQPAMIEKIMRVGETTTQAPSGFVQSLISELVMGPQNAAAAKTFASLRPKEQSTFTGWKTDGWVRWLEGLRGEYERRMYRMCKILDQGAFQVKQGTPVVQSDQDWGVITKTRLLDFEWPRGGMFVWVRVYFEKHPLYDTIRRNGMRVDGTSLATAMMILGIKEPFRVLAGVGLMFGATDEIAEQEAWQYSRLCFAAAADDVIERSTKHYVQLIHRFWKIKRIEELEDLLEDEPHASALEELGDLDNIGLYMGC